ncbi:hypothetical protein [Oricola thermophila]|uniref:Lipoprotein n=1 Tax=Oricola thermophila TaxID=2742145 RepID=A0A6N1V8S9_9HYPH|nr:hypothetical protein [Oricola thermophila]QKV17108.1 hypothetical protein HTY61_00830 [Oricola thermophila]
MTGTMLRLASLACALLLVSACTGTDSGLGIGQPQDPDEAAAEARFPAIAGDAAAQGAVTAANTPTDAPEIARVYFAPVVGVSVDKVEPLSKRLGSVGSASGVRLVPAEAGGYTHEIKGYFSAFTESGSTTVVHVWDVITPSGQRVHRIQGQETVPGATPDPWASVPPATMEAIADSFMLAYTAWLKSGA